MKKNNKGFSLVELIIVIAIMAVLMAVLAPQFLRYVERSRLQSDNTTIAEIANACKIAATDENIANAVIASGATGLTVDIELTDAGALTVSNTDLATELTNTIGEVALTSNTYVALGANRPQIQIVMNGATVQVQATHYIPEVGAAEEVHVF